MQMVNSVQYNSPRRSWLIHHGQLRQLLQILVGINQVGIKLMKLIERHLGLYLLIRPSLDQRIVTIIIPKNQLVRISKIWLCIYLKDSFVRFVLRGTKMVEV